MNRDSRVNVCVAIGVDDHQSDAPVGALGCIDGQVGHRTGVGGSEFLYFLEAIVRAAGDGIVATLIEHSATDNDGALGLATLRLDGFVSLEAKDRPGTLVTRPFELAGSILELNVDAPDGEVVVEILDQKGTPIAGFTGKDAKVLRDVDTLRLRPAWNRSKLASLVGRVVRVKITLTRGKLYALQVKP